MSETVTVSLDARHADFARRAAKALRAMPYEPDESDIESVTGTDPENTAKAAARTNDRLRSLVDRIERLEGERRNLGSDIKDIFKEAQSAGFDAKVLRMLLRERRQDAAKVQLQLELLGVYREAVA
jgi:uncharacterized protein (UPF0335 family)